MTHVNTPQFITQLKWNDDLNSQLDEGQNLTPNDDLIQKYVDMCCDKAAIICQKNDVHFIAYLINSINSFIHLVFPI